MAQEIQPLLANESVATGSTGPVAQPSDFGGKAQGLLSLAHGVGQVADAAAHIGQLQLAERIRVKQEQDTLWTGETVEQERRAWQDWLATPENANDPQAGAKFIDFAKSRIAAVASEAPSPDAARAARIHLASVMTRHYADAQEAGRRALINTGVESFDRRVALANSSFRAGGSLTDAVEARNNVFNDVDNLIGRYSKESADKLKARYETEFIYAAIDSRPEDARALLNKSTVLDEHQRFTLSRTIDSAERRVNQTALYDLNKLREDVHAQWQAGSNFNEIPLERYTAVLPKEQAVLKKREDDETRTTLIRAFDEYSSVADRAPQYQVQHLEHLASTVGNASDANVVKFLSQKVSESQRLFNSDKTAWLAENNREVRAATQKVLATSGPERAQALDERARLVLRFQGPPPEGVAPAEAQMYLNLPVNERSILSKPEIDTYAARINSGSPSDAVKVVDELNATYGERNGMVAFNDLVRNGGVKQEYQLAIQNRGAWWVDSYMAAIHNAPAVGALTADEQLKLGQRLSSNPTWLTFQRSMIGDNMQHATELAGFRTGILQYAKSMVLKGGSDKDSVNRAVDMLIGETLGFTSVNDRPLVLPRTDLAGNHRDDNHLADIGRRLTVALSMIDPLKVDPSHFNLKALEGKPVELAQRVRDLVTSNGFYQPMPDGQGVTLYFADTNGDAFQLRDKHGRAFVIRYDELPTLMADTVDVQMSSQPYTPPTGQTRTRLTPIMPKKTYDLMTQTGSDLFGTTEYRSHWPIQPSWIRMQ